MRLTRFSIGGLMGLVLVIALGLVGLKQANTIWASTFFTVTLVALVISVLNAIQTRERSRVFWVGFAVSGWIYFLCAFGLGSESGAATPQVLTEKLLDQLLPLFHPEAAPDSALIPIAVQSNASPALAVPPPPPATPESDPAQTPDLALPSSTAAPLNFPSAYYGYYNRATGTISNPYHQIGHSLASLIVAYLGGLYSLLVAVRRDRREAESAPGVSPSSP